MASVLVLAVTFSLAILCWRRATTQY